MDSRWSKWKERELYDDETDGREVQKVVEDKKGWVISFVSTPGVVSTCQVLYLKIYFSVVYFLYIDVNHYLRERTDVMVWQKSTLSRNSDYSVNMTNPV